MAPAGRVGHHLGLVGVATILVLIAGGARMTISALPMPRAVAGPAILDVTLEGTEFKWKPNVVTVQRDQRVRFRVVNKGAIEHTFVSAPARIPETKEIPPGGQVTVEWKAPSRPGSLEFWCGVPGHREAGMVGKIVVK